MLNQFAQLIIGFSIFASVILLFAYLFFLPDMRKSLAGKLFCTVLLLELAGIQFAHYLHFIAGVDLVAIPAYVYLLLSVPPTFYFFSRDLLFPDTQLSTIDSLHLLPLLIGLFCPLAFIPVFAFLIGTGYTFWFAIVVYRLRDQSGRFKFEMFFFGLFALMALMALLLGLSIPYIDHAIFYTAYAIAIGLALVLVMSVLISQRAQFFCFIHQYGYRLQITV